MTLFKRTLLGAALLAAGFAAQAASYNFDVQWNGSSASLASGSDDPLATTMNAGDTFTYTLSAVGGDWKVVNGGDIFPFFALYVSEVGTRTGDFTLDLGLNGGNVFTHSEVGATNSFIHVGTNTVTVNTGLEFDKIQLAYSITSATTTSTPTSLLPWPGLAPEQYSPDKIIFQPVPEPETYALLLAGMGVVGFAARRRRAAR